MVKFIALLASAALYITGLIALVNALVPANTPGGFRCFLVLLGLIIPVVLAAAALERRALR